jgi:hypothetical protein
VQQGMHCSVLVQPDRLVVASDRDRVEGHHEEVLIDPADNPHDHIVAALKRFLPLGGRCSLIDSDPSFLAAPRRGPTALIDPHLLGAQADAEVVLVPSSQAIAALIRSTNPISYDLTKHEFVPTEPFALIQITEGASATTFKLALVDAKGKATPATTPSPGSVNLGRAGHVCTELLPHLLKELDTTPSAVIVLSSESATFGQVLSDHFAHQLAGEPYPVNLLCDRYAALAGGLVLAQRPLED